MKEAELNILKRSLDNSNYCVCLLGKELDFESGIENIRDDDVSYSIEEENGYAVEEIFSSYFINSRPEKAFGVVQKYVVPQLEKTPQVSYEVLRELEARGKIKSMITRSFYGMAKKAGCQNVIEMRGNFNDCFCNKCKTRYNILDLDDSIIERPVCEKCGGLLRPAITLFGDMIPIDRITKATDEVSKADFLLVLGAGLRSTLCKSIVKYFNGKNLILIHEGKEVGDSSADMVIHECPKDVLPKLL